MRGAPYALIALRLGCAPLILAAAFLGRPGRVMLGIAGVALLSDYLDGAIARRLGTDTPRLRHLDSQVDTLFYFAAGIAMFVRYPEVWRAFRSGIAVLLVVEIGRILFEWRKFGRTAAYHMWSAKLWGVSMLLGFGEVTLTGHGGLLLTAAIVLGVVSNLEGITASLLFREWRHDVPTFWHAVQSERRRS